jgi:hypothetical protein
MLDKTLRKQICSLKELFWPNHFKCVVKLSSLSLPSFLMDVMVTFYFHPRTCINSSLHGPFTRVAMSQCQNPGFGGDFNIFEGRKFLFVCFHI